MRIGMVAGVLALPACQAVFPLHEPPHDGPDTPDTPVDVAPIDRDLILHLTFDDPDKLATDDQNHDVACLSACPLPAADRHGVTSAAVFGNGACLQVTPAPDLDPPVIAVALWARVPVPPSQSGGELLARGHASMADASNVVEVFIDQSQVFHLGIAGISRGMQLDDNWHHLVASFDGLSLTTYIDGAMMSTATGTSLLFYTADPFTVGCDLDPGGPVAFLDGAVDDIRVYRRVLTPTEVAELAVR